MLFVLRWAWDVCSPAGYESEAPRGLFGLWSSLPLGVTRTHRKQSNEDFRLKRPQWLLDLSLIFGLATFIAGLTADKLQLHYVCYTVLHVTLHSPVASAQCKCPIHRKLRFGCSSSCPRGKACAKEVQNLPVQPDRCPFGHGSVGAAPYPNYVQPSDLVIALNIASPQGEVSARWYWKHLVVTSCSMNTNVPTIGIGPAATYPNIKWSWKKKQLPSYGSTNSLQLQWTYTFGSHGAFTSCAFPSHFTVYNIYIYPAFLSYL